MQMKLQRQDRRETIQSIGGSNERNKATIIIQCVEQKTQRKHVINNRKWGKSVKKWVNKTASTILKIYLVVAQNAPK